MTTEPTSKRRPRLTRRLRDRWRRLTPGLEGLRAVVRRWRQRLPAPFKRVLRRVTRWSLGSVLGVVLVIVALLVAARWWLPTLVENKSDIERFVTTAVGSPAHFDRIESFWDRLNPGVRVQGFRIDSREPGVAAVRLREVRLSLAWWPLLTGRIEINSLALVEPSLTIEHQADGRFRLTGLDLPARDPAQEDFSDWLLRQRRMEVENGNLVWIDRPAPGAAEERLDIRHVNATLLSDGDRHRLDLRATFPEALCVECRVTADVRGNPLRSSEWSGSLTLRAHRLSLSRLPRILAVRLPAGLDGRLDVRLESRWKDGWPQRVHGGVVAHQLSVPVAGLDKPLLLPSLDTMVDWQGDRERGRLDLARLTFGLTRAPWVAGRVRVDYAPERAALDVEHIEVGDLVAFANGLGRSGAAFDWLRAAVPNGAIDHLQVAIDGPWTQPNDARVSAEVRGLQFAAYNRLPGMTALSGRLDTTLTGGEFQVDAGPNRLELPRVFRSPLDVQRLTSRITWRAESDHWAVRVGDLRLQTSDGRAQGEVALRIPFDRGQSPVLDLDIAVPEGTLTHAARYYPRIMPDGLRRYLDRAIVSGAVSNGRVLFQGALRQFPFRDGSGHFEVQAHVRHGVFEYLRGWEPLRDIETDLRFTGLGMEITAPRATLHGMEVGRLVVGIDDFQAEGGAVVAVSGRVTGGMADAIDVLVASRWPPVTPYVVPGLRATGDGVLTLNLQIPARDPSALRLAGDYQVQGGSLVFPFRAIRADALRGRIDFTESGLRAGELQGRLLGGDTRIEVTPVPGPTPGARLELRGVVGQDGLDQVFGQTLAAAFRGEVPWSATVAARRDHPDWELRADLHALQLSLPAPLAKAKDQPLALTIRSLPGTAVDRQVVDLQAEGRVTGRLAFNRGTDGWTFDRGRIGIGERITQLPDAAGLQLSARLPSLNADNWWKLMRESATAAGTTGWFDYVTRLSAEVDALEVFDRPFGHQVLDIGKVGDQWRGTVQGDSLSGRVSFQGGCGPGSPCAPAGPLAASVPATHPTIGFDLDQLTWPPAPSGATSGTQGVDPRALPNVNLTSAAFSAHGLTFGALAFRAEPTDQGWRITQLSLSTPNSTLTAHGLWAVDWQGQQSCGISVSVSSKDFGKALQQLGYPDELIGGELSIGSQWSWPGTPGDWSLAMTNGELTMRLTKGRFIKISPGAGRILGVLDLRSLSRYLTLDMSSIFGKGLTFDSIRGKFAFAQGNAETRNLEIHVPGADMDITGRLGLVARDLDMEMRVTPRLATELVVGGTIVGGPVVGAAVGLLHQIVKKPFEKSTQIRYTIKGSWDDPAVVRVGGPPPAAPSDTQP